jgi:MinD superfamily P-loop ATPase
MGADFAYCVTEPTPMGAYDLELILELCKKLKVPAKIILNQSDLGNKKRVEQIAKKFKIEIEKEIPYSKEIADAYSQGKLLSSDYEI